jgi:hypothetical protein
VKRLQDGPRERKTKELRRTISDILKKLDTSLTEMIPEIKMEKAGRSFTRYTRRQEITSTTIASHMEEGVTLLDTLTVSGMTSDVTAQTGGGQCRHRAGRYELLGRIGDPELRGFQ